MERSIIEMILVEIVLIVVAVSKVFSVLAYFISIAEDLIFFFENRVGEV